MSCTIEGCELKVFRRGWCSGHWHRWQRHGDPTAGRIKHGDGPKTLEAMINTDTPDCLIWPNGKSGWFDGTPNGYGAVWLNGRQQSAHIIICERVHGPRPTSSHEVAHSCNNPCCVNWRHLRWATHRENMADQLIHGTRLRGERCPSARLSESKVREVRSMAAAGLRQQAIADHFGVNPHTISNVINRRTWAWVD